MSVIAERARTEFAISTPRRRDAEELHAPWIRIDFVGREAAHAAGRKPREFKSHAYHKLLIHAAFFLPRAGGAKSMWCSVLLCLCVKNVQC